MIDTKEYIFIKGSVPSLKNSKIATSHGVFYSKTVRKYLNSLGIQSYSPRKRYVKEYVDKINHPPLFRDAFKGWKKPTQCIKMYFHFVRGTRHKWDFINMVQIIADLMTAYNFLEDDNMDYFIPFPLKSDGKYYSYDNDNPGVFIKFENEE